MKLLIFEGIDRIGKTTFIKQYSEKLKERGFNVITDLHETDWIPNVKLNQPPLCYEYTNLFNMTPMLNWFKLMNNNSVFNNTVFILDRSYMSALVYGQIKRRTIIEDLYSSLEIFEDIHLQYEEQLVKIFGKDFKYVQFITDKIGIEDDLTKIEDLKKANELYDSVFFKSKALDKFIIKLTTDIKYQSDILEYLEHPFNIFHETK